MHTVVYLPFILTAVVVALSRLAAHRLAPRAGAWAITLAVSAVTLCTVGALGLLAFPLLARVPLIAHLGRWRPTAVAVHTPVPAWLSIFAIAALGVVAWRSAQQLRSLANQLGEVSQAHAELARYGTGELVVMDDVMPRAHAVSPGEVV